MHPMNTVTDDELDYLAQFCTSDDVPQDVMDIPMLEGFLTALAIGPRLVRPSAWLPWVWDYKHGKAEMIFASGEQANEIVGLLLGWWNQITQTFQRDPESFVPAFRRREEWRAAEWCEGFLHATQLFDAGDWAQLWLQDAAAAIGGPHQGSLATPFLRLCDEEGLLFTDTEDEATRWEAASMPALLAINAWWAPQRKALAGEMATNTPFRRSVPKAGRNEPCPCGSGKKYKHCHGQAPTRH